MKTKEIDVLIKPKELNKLIRSRARYECDNCGQPSTHYHCSKACYLICKADYEMDQEE